MRKMILLSAVAALILLQTSCDTSQSLSIFNTWSSSGITTGAMYVTNVVLTFNSNGTWSETIQTSGTVTISGTFSPTTLPPDTNITFTVVASSDPIHVPIGMTVLIKYTNLTATTVDVYSDSGSGFEGPFQFHKM